MILTILPHLTRQGFDVILPKSNALPTRSLVAALFLLLCFGERASALDPFRSLLHYRLDTWTTEQGLPHNSINSIIQTDDGFLWIATLRGVVRFDGIQFQSIHVPPSVAEHCRNYVALLQSPDGSVWIATEGGGLLRVALDSVQVFDPAHGFADDYVTCLALDSTGGLWVGTSSSGIYEAAPPYDLQNARRFTTETGLPSNEIRDICAGESNDAWATTWTGALMRLSTTLEPQVSVVQNLPAKKGYYLMRRPDGMVSVSTKDGLYTYHHGQFTLAIPSAVPGSDFFVSMTQDRDGNTWAGSYLSGLFRLTPPLAGGSVSVVSKKMGLAGNYVSALCEDTEGSIWVGTEVGLNRLSDGSVVTLSDVDGFTDESANALTQTPDGTLWAGTDGGGLVRIQHGKVTGKYGIRDGIRDPFVSTVAVDNRGRLLLSTEDSCLYLFTEGKGASLLVKTPSKVNALLNGKDGSYWCASSTGIDRLSPTTFRVIPPSYHRDGTPGTCLLATTDGDIWAGTRDGLVVFRDTAITVFHREDGLPSDYITCLAQDSEGAVWVGTSEGIARRTGNRFETFGSRQGITEQYVTCLIEDARGFFWLGTLSGIYRIAHSDFDSVASGSWLGVRTMAFGESDGMKSNECMEGGNVGLQDRLTGAIWISTTRGIATIDPAHLRTHPILSPLWIEGVTVSPSKMYLHKPFELSAGENNFTIQYTLPAFLIQNRLRFQYRLEEFDQDWVDAGTRRFATYTNVPPGTYSFVVRAHSEVPGSAPVVRASIELSIAPRFYERKVFYLGIGILFIAGLATSHFVRVRRAEERERTLARMVDVRTQALRESESHRQAILQVMPLILYTARTPDEFGANWITENTWEVTGFPPERFLQEQNFWVSRIHPEDLTRVQTYLELVRSGKAGDIEYRWRCADGSYHWFLDHTVRLQEGKDGKVEYSGVWFDITDKIEAEEQLRVSLREKEALLREVHHRVKNNLTIITSLLNLQASTLEDPQLRDVLQEAEGRVRSMATLHEHLYKSNYFGAVDLKSYIASLVRTLSRTYRKAGVEIVTDIEGVALDIALAIPCGLIVNELVTNAMKYAFPQDRVGRVAVSLKHPSPQKYILEVCDNGIGFTVPSDLENTPTLGLKLVAILGRQLDGKLSMVSGPGTSCILEFPGIAHPA
ncbi:MAG: two-component regulator propeller domain-containing protein [Bacteroidota bacterium]